MLQQQRRTLLSIGLLGTVALAPLGCSKDDAPIDIGENVGAKLTDYAANWEGYAEAYTFSDGSDRVRLTLAGDGHGKLRVGDLDLFPPPTDPNVGYPVGLTTDLLPGITLLNPVLGPGFEYSVLQTQVKDNRIQLGVDIHELYSAWCAMQTPYFDAVHSSPPNYFCSEPGASPSRESLCTQLDPATNQDVPLDCRKQALCTSPDACVCTSTGCATPPLNGTPGTRIDGALETAGAQLVGTLVVDGSTRVNIRLVRK